MVNYFVKVDGIISAAIVVLLSFILEHIYQKLKTSHKYTAVQAFKAKHTLLMFLYLAALITVVIVYQITLPYTGANYKITCLLMSYTICIAITSLVDQMFISD